MGESPVRTRDRKIPGILTNNFLRYLFSPPERLVRKYAGHGQRLADLGCGAGYYTLAMARIASDGGHVFAVDFDPKAIERLERRAKRRGCASIIEARTTSASEIDFIEGGSIHFVLAEGLLCCMADHAGAVRQIQRILHPDGRAYLSVIKLSRPDDPRGVSRDEWERLLASFRLLDRGESLLTRWALVGRGDGDLAGSHARHLPCC